MTDLEIAIGSELNNASYSSIAQKEESVAKNMEAIYIDSLEGLEEELNPSEINTLIRNLYLALHPVGDIVINNTGTNPGFLYGGKWEVFGPGRTLVGVDYTKTEYKKPNLEGGKKFNIHTHTYIKHTHTVESHAHQIDHTHQIDPHTHLLRPHIHEMQHKHAFPHTHGFYHSHLQSIGWKEENQYVISLIGDSQYTETKEKTACYWKASKKFEIGYKVPRAFTSWKTVLFQPVAELSLGKQTTIFTGESQVLYRESKEETKSTYPRYGALKQLEVNETTEMKNNIGDTNPKTASVYLSTLQPYIVCYMFRRIS